MDDPRYDESGEMEQIQDDRDGLVSKRRGTTRRRLRSLTREGFEDSPGELPTIQFRAILAERGAVKFDAEGSAKVTLDIPASEVPEVVKLLLYAQRLMNITIVGDS